MNIQPTTARTTCSRYLPRLALAPALFVAALGSSSGCSAIVQELTDRCTNTSDCTGKGSGFENATCVDGLCRQGVGPVGPDTSPWGCLASNAPRPKAAAPEATIFFRFVDPVNDKPVSGIKAKACGNIDPTCSMPLSAVTTSDAEGLTQLSFTTSFAAGSEGFLGYFYLEGGDVNLATPPQPRLPHLFSVLPPMIADREASFRVVTLTQYKDFSAFVGLTVDPERSLLIVQSRNCQNVPTPRSTLQVIGADAKTRVLYLSGGFPSETATETDDSGTAFFVNTEPGIATVEITNLDAGLRVARTSLAIRKDHVTYAEIAPILDNLADARSASAKVGAGRHRPAARQAADPAAQGAQATAQRDASLRRAAPQGAAVGPNASLRRAALDERPPGATPTLGRAALDQRPLGSRQLDQELGRA